LEGKIEGYLDLVRASASSSWRLLQNAYSCKNPSEQGVSLALALSERFIEEQCGSRGASRVHGGGFAGTIQVYIPLEKEEAYIGNMESVFGKGCVKRLRIRQKGASRLDIG
jgi:galactokinase